MGISKVMDLKEEADAAEEKAKLLKAESVKEQAMEKNVNHAHTWRDVYRDIKHEEEGKSFDTLVKDAWVETINHPEVGHDETTVITPAWDEESEVWGTIKMWLVGSSSVVYPHNIEHYLNDEIIDIEGPDSPMLAVRVGNKYRRLVGTAGEWVVATLIDMDTCIGTETIHHEAEMGTRYVVDSEA